MAFLERPPTATDNDPAFSLQLRGATDLLERLAADWSLLDWLPPADRARFHRAIAGLTTPEARAGRTRARQRSAIAGSSASGRKKRCSTAPASARFAAVRR